MKACLLWSSLRRYRQARDWSVPGRRIIRWRGVRVTSPRFAPAQVRQMMAGCWAADPSLRPGFDSLVIQLGGSMSRTDRQSYDARSRLDSGIGDSHLVLDDAYCVDCRHGGGVRSVQWQPDLLSHRPGRAPVSPPSLHTQHRHRLQVIHKVSLISVSSSSSSSPGPGPSLNAQSWAGCPAPAPARCPAQRCQEPTTGPTTRLVHAVLTIIIHVPGDDKLRVPGLLVCWRGQRRPEV